MICTYLWNVPENVCGHKSLSFSTTRGINGTQTLMDLQYLVTTAEFGVYACILSVLLACFVLFLYVYALQLHIVLS